MNNNKCSECKHQLICKYISDFKKFDEEIERLRKLLQAEGIDLSIFNTEINCEFFARESKLNPPPTISDLLMSYGSKDDYGTINKQNPCENYEFYKKTAKRRGIYWRFALSMV